MHRDLKPGNVMLTRSGVKLLDFGLAKAMTPATQQSSLTALPTQQGLTQEGTILGTFQYMAPEQLEGKDADGRTDIFAFGAVLYEMATGKKAFAGANQASLITAIMSSEPAPISAVQPTSPAALDRVVRTCLAKDPEERWQSASDLKRELRWIGEGSQSGASAQPAVAARAAERLAGRLVGRAVVRRRRARRARLGLWLRPLRRGPSAVHSFVLPPEKTAFELTGDESAPPAISPDGERIVFGASGKLWVQSLSNGVTAALAATERGAVSVLVPRQPIHRLLLGRKAQDDRGRGRPGAGPLRRAHAARRQLGPRRRHRVRRRLPGRALPRSGQRRHAGGRHETRLRRGTRRIAGPGSSRTASTSSISRRTTPIRSRRTRRSTSDRSTADRTGA